MSKKLYDLTVKVGSYQKGGETKNRYVNVGAVMENEHGMYLMLNRTFNPAGVPNPSGGDSVLINCFEPRQRQQGTPQGDPNDVPF